MGLAYPALSLTVLAEASPGEEGAATSSLQLSDVLGTALGAGVGGALIAAGLGAGHSPWVGLLAAFTVACAVALGGLALTGRIPGRRSTSLPGAAAGEAPEPAGRG
jgi:predicted MFS family arabinose efflux permease